MTAPCPEHRQAVASELEQIATLERDRGPFAAPILRSQLRLAARASPWLRERKSKRAVTRNILDRLIGTWGTDCLTDKRELAILFA